MKTKFLLILLLILACANISSASPVYVYVTGDNLKVGQVGEYNIILDKAPTGLSKYGISLFLSTDSAEIVDVVTPNWATITEFIETSSSIWLEAVDFENNVKTNNSSIILATIKLGGVSKGNVLLILKVVYLVDDNNNPLDYIEGSCIITVESVSLPGHQDQSIDLDNDGLYEDVNGDHVFNFGDVVDFFEAFDSIPLEDWQYYDFNGDGSVNFGDVIALFKML